jgi:hypothetical protein
MISNTKLLFGRLSITQMEQMSDAEYLQHRKDTALLKRQQVGLFVGLFGRREVNQSTRDFSQVLKWLTESSRR